MQAQGQMVSTSALPGSRIAVGLRYSPLIALGRKLASFINQGARHFVPDSETLHTRQMQSSRIKLRLLARAGNYDEVFTTAQSTDEEEIAAIAVLEILHGNLKDSDQSDLLIQLARSDSRAAVPAMVVLFNRGYTRLAQSIFVERMHNGDLSSLVRSGKAKLFSILDIMGTIDAVEGTNYSDQHFESLFECMESEEKRNFLLAEILGDPKPDGYRCSFERNMIARCVKLQAIGLVQESSPAAMDRALFYGSKDEDDVIAHHAVYNVMKLWRSELGKLPEGLESFPMADTALLSHLCQISSDFQWQDPSGAERIFREFSNCSAELERIEVTSPLRAKLQGQVDSLQQDIIRITESRINGLHPLIDRITTALRIPNANVAATDDDTLCAAYLVGTGSIEINRTILLEDKPLSEELMSSLLHEIGHMEQDVLVIRMIADDLNLKFGQHSQLLLPLYERYARGIGYAPRSMFLLAVLRLRDDQLLTAEQRRRALRLLEAAHQTKLGHEQGKALQHRISHMEQSQQALEQGAYDHQLLSLLRDQHALAALFNRGEVPGVLLYEIAACKEEIDEIVTPYLKHAAFMRRDPISIAQQLYNSEHREKVYPTIHRLKTLLLQVLTEEHRRLLKKLSEIRRAGYHEYEAYCISDRVEVIVKALRKGW
ncbi:MAG TPA: hypothetical protein V6C81_20735 [Planktothrix sp.]|jgi:hypothetical protein